ncbi:MAG TPA: DinB family protein, partial [Chitinophagales bacterium]|nr:DinB family protein [Chitinophagales bacterium]
MPITKPEASEHARYYTQYIAKVTENDLTEALENSFSQTIGVLKTIPADKADFSYAPGKWTVKQLLTHLTDAERIFAYRALTFARNDQTALPAFDEELYAPESNAENRTLDEVITDYENVRRSTLSL